MNSTNLSSNPLIQLKFPLNVGAKTCITHLGIATINPRRRRRRRKLSTTIWCTPLDDSQRTTNQQQQLNLSVLRFTLGIPGLDESYLPRWIGYVFGSLLLLNHFVGSNSTTSAQLRSEALGLSLAGFSIVIPYLGKFLKGASIMDQTTLPEDAEQIFVMSLDIRDILKEDLAWGTFILLRNTNAISVLISIEDALCVRGYWNTPEDVSKANVLEWFKQQIEQIGLLDLQDTLYIPQCADSEFWEMLPNGTRSILVQPVLRAPNERANQMEKTEGFVLLASTLNYAYNDKDRAWIGAVANKFREPICLKIRRDVSWMKEEWSRLAEKEKKKKEKGHHSVLCRGLDCEARMLVQT